MEPGRTLAFVSWAGKILSRKDRDKASLRPDRNRDRFRHNMPTGKPSSCLTIRLTPKWLHEIAASIFHGENTFIFNELSISTTSFSLISIQTALPMCDFVTMRDFFIIIGPNNRRMLKHIKLQFKTVSQFISSTHKVIYRCSASFGGDKVLAEAIKLLARSHSLGTVEIVWVKHEALQSCSGLGFSRILPAPTGFLDESKLNDAQRRDSETLKDGRSPEQRIALDEILSNDSSIHVVQSTPGTGKTTFVTDFLLKVFAVFPRTLAIADQQVERLQGALTTSDTNAKEILEPTCYVSSRLTKNKQR